MNETGHEGFDKDMPVLFIISISDWKLWSWVGIENKLETSDILYGYKNGFVGIQPRKRRFQGKKSERLPREELFNKLISRYASFATIEQQAIISMPWLAKVVKDFSDEQSKIPENLFAPIITAVLLHGKIEGSAKLVGKSSSFLNIFMFKIVYNAEYANLETKVYNLNYKTFQHCSEMLIVVRSVSILWFSNSIGFVPVVKLEYFSQVQILNSQNWTWTHLHWFALDARVKVEIQNWLETRRKMKNTRVVASSFLNSKSFWVMILMRQALRSIWVQIQMWCNSSLVIRKYHTMHT